MWTILPASATPVLPIFFVIARLPCARPCGRPVNSTSLFIICQSNNFVNERRPGLLRLTRLLASGPEFPLWWRADPPCLQAFARLASIGHKDRFRRPFNTRGKNEFQNRRRSHPQI